MMTRAELLQQYIDMGEPSPRSLRSKKYKWFMDILRSEFPFLSDIDGVSARHYVICLKENINEYPKCNYCGNAPSSVSDKGFRDFCSKSCTAKGSTEKKRQTSLERYGTTHHLKNKDQQTKQRATVHEKYGVDSVSQLEYVKNKVKSTNEERYGDSTFFATDRYKEKTRETSLERYGVEHYSSSDIVKENRKNTFKCRYGVEAPLQYKEFADKAKKTNYQKFGFEYVSQSPLIQDKIKKASQETYGVDHHLMASDVRSKIKSTNKNRYGTENVMQSKEIRERTKKTNQEKYGRDYVSQKDLPDKAYSILRSPQEVENHYKGFLSIIEASIDLGVSNSTYGRYIKSHGIEKKLERETSIGHREIIAFLVDECGVERDSIIVNDRTHLPSQQEIDVFLPEYNVGIEYNGWYWHSDFFKEEKYHQSKSLEAIQSGIRLLHVWEYDWRNDPKQSIIKSKIKHMLGVGVEKVFARKTTVQKLAYPDASSFFNKHHIQGGKRATEYYGLIYEGRVVACLAMRKKRGEVYDVSRYATSCSVVGGFSKLLKSFMREYPEVKRIESFCSLDYGNGKMYESVGFAKESITRPNYRYIKNKDIVSRERAMKSKLNDLLDSFDPSLSERGNMINHGFVKIFDSGSIKYVLQP